MTDNANATLGELEELNGLLVRELISKIKAGNASGTELATASKLIVSNKIIPESRDREAYKDGSVHHDLDFPVQFPVDFDE